MSLVVVEASPTEVAVAQGLLQEVTAVQLVPRVLDLAKIGGQQTSN